MKEGNHKLMIVPSKQNKNNSLTVEEDEENNMALEEPIFNIFHSKDIFYFRGFQTLEVDPCI